MKRRLVGLPVCLLVCLLPQACSASHSCTGMAGNDSLTVTIPRSMYFSAERAAIEICDDTSCGSTTRRLPRQDRRADSHGIAVGWSEFGRRFGPGPVRVTVTLTSPDGDVLAVAHRETDTKLSYPNGRTCDGDGYLSGQVNMRPSDRV